MPQVKAMPRKTSSKKKREKKPYKSKVPESKWKTINPVKKPTGRASIPRKAKATLFDVLVPAGIKGKWVHRKKYKNSDTSSFGKFKCSECNHVWVSAHAWKNYGQQCQRCKRNGKGKKLIKPWLLWANAKGEPTKKESDNKVKKPHKSALCERCIKGLPCAQ